MSDMESVVEESEIKHIGTVLEGLELLDEESISGVRRAFPHLRFTLCSEDDIGMREPFITCSGFDLHLVASAPGSCSALTYDLAKCTGIVVALHEE